jgi:hypothetical protein
MIQYPKQEHIILPSFEGGLGTLPILRDPPKSIHTRFIEKVGDTSRLTNWIDSEDAGNRICEMINKYPRGVNPMVDVSYTNEGTSGGQVRYRGGMIGTDQAAMSSSSNQAYLPYRVARDGAFRPPVIPPEQLLPLSRQSRLPTSHTTNPSAAFMQATQKQGCQADLRAIRNELRTICAPPRASFNLQTPAGAPSQITYSIREPRHASAQTNKGQTRYRLGLPQMPDRGIQEKRTYQIQTTPGVQYQGSSIESYHGNQPMPVKPRLQGSVGSNVKQIGERNGYMNPNHTLNRTYPHASMETNRTTQSVDVNANVQSRSYALAPRLHRGSFASHGTQPQTTRTEPTVPTQKIPSVLQKASQMFERYNMSQ